MAQGINVAVTGNKKTITSDLQLYLKAMQLREKNDMKNLFADF